MAQTGTGKAWRGTHLIRRRHSAPPWPARRPRRQNSFVNSCVGPRGKEKQGEGWRLQRTWGKRGATLTSAASDLLHLAPRG